MQRREADPGPTTSARPFVRERASGPFWYAKWLRAGRPVIRALGPAWVAADGGGGWKPRRGQPRDGARTEAQAVERMLQLMREHDEEASRLEQDADARRREGVTFRALAREYLVWLRRSRTPSPRRSWLIATA